MARPFKLAIVRARHDTTVSTLPDDVCREMLMTGEQSVLRYWEDITNGWFDFVDSAMFPWVDFVITPAAVDRTTQATLAFAALRAANPGQDPLAGFDGAFVLSLPGQGAITNPKAGQPGQAPTIFGGFDGGSGTVAGLRTSVIPANPSDHTFMCHELGHTLGCEHTFGLDNNGTDYDPSDTIDVVSPEYGDPFDLMSSASFGSRYLGSGPTYSSNPTFSGTPLSGWPNANAAQMGPALSRANLHRWFPDALAGQVIEHPFPADGDTQHVNLAKASAPSGYTLLILHPPDEAADGAGRVYVEYRPSDSWDRGLGGLTCGLARPGIIIHTLEDVPGVGTRVWYRGEVIDGGSDTDFALAARPLVITVEQDGDGAVQFAVRTAADHAATITVDAIDEISSGTDIQRMQTPCGDTVATGTWSTKSTGRFGVRSTGFSDAATVSWQLGGVALAPPGAAGLAVRADDGRDVLLQYSIDPAAHVLSLFSSGGDAYTVTVVATVTEGPDTATATATFSPPGSYQGFTPESIGLLGKCIARKAHEVGEIPTLDVAALLDHHEIHEWQEDVGTLTDQLIGLGPAVATQFTQFVDVPGEG
jgi:hypothetical protein